MHHVPPGTIPQSFPSRRPLDLASASLSMDTGVPRTKEFPPFEPKTAYEREYYAHEKPCRKQRHVMSLTCSLRKALTDRCLKAPSGLPSAPQLSLCSVYGRSRTHHSVLVSAFTCHPHLLLTLFVNSA